MLDIIRDIFETIDNKSKNRKFDMQTSHAANGQECSTNKDLQIKLEADNMNGDKILLPWF